MLDVLGDRGYLIALIAAVVGMALVAAGHGVYNSTRAPRRGRVSAVYTLVFGTLAVIVVWFLFAWLFWLLLFSDQNH